MPHVGHIRQPQVKGWTAQVPSVFCRVPSSHLPLRVSATFTPALIRLVRLMEIWSFAQLRRRWSEHSHIRTNSNTISKGAGICSNLLRPRDVAPGPRSAKLMWKHIREHGIHMWDAAYHQPVPVRQWTRPGSGSRPALPTRDETLCCTKMSVHRVYYPQKAGCAAL